MAGLALKLAPKERVLINGVIVENGPRRAQLLIKTDNASVLRLRDALEPSDVIGPASEAYFAAQRCVAGEISAENAEEIIMPLLLQLAELDTGDENGDVLQKIKNNLNNGNCYRAMRGLRPLVEFERGAIPHSAVAL